MSELGHETNALLAEGRDGERLAPADKARLRRALVSQIAATSVIATSSTAAAWMTATAKAVGVVVLIGTALAGTAVLSSSGAKRVTVVATAPAKPVSQPAIGVIPPLASAITVRPAASTIPTIAAEVPEAPPRPNPHALIVQSQSSSPEAPKPRPPSALEEEARLFREADDALKSGDPDRALRVLGDLAVRFPDGTLAPERSAERIFALCMKGQRDEARDAARVFLRTEVAGPLAARVHASCGGEAL